MKRKIKVLVVDDSAAVRKALREILESDPELEVTGTAQDPFVAAELMRAQVPDVITLDIEMPRMDGLTFLEKIMSQHPIPVVVCSSVTEAGSQAALIALERGAVDIITKPKLATTAFLRESSIRVCDAVKAAAQVRLKRRPAGQAARPDTKTEAPELLMRSDAPVPSQGVVVIGASTGGTEALAVILQSLSPRTPGILVVLHMPEKFTTFLAARLDASCKLRVKEASDHDALLRGQVLIAPGDRHMQLRRSDAGYHVEVSDGPLVNRHRPSVDVLFRSAARHAGASALGIILTGMGDDGARGLLEMKQAGARSIAQDEASCVVFGMPNEAIHLGAVDAVLPLDRIAAEIVRRFPNDGLQFSLRTSKLPIE